KVLAANGHRMRYHRTANFPFLLSAAEGNEQIGNYESCLKNLEMAHIGHRTNNRNSYPTQNAYSGAGQNQSYGRSYGGGSTDAAHHAAGHTHHHGH
ncbi:MAG: hypothetical protein ACE1ZA_02730, partial [Pseudomonadales bacterium]